jgi:hypothetical protein
LKLVFVIVSRVVSVLGLSAGVVVEGRGDLDAALSPSAAGPGLDVESAAPDDRGEYLDGFSRAPTG